MVYHHLMSKTNKILDQMRNNPRDWRIESLEAVAKRLGIKVRKPPGSHVIIKQFLALVDDILRS